MKTLPILRFVLLTTLLCPTIAMSSPDAEKNWSLSLSTAFYSDYMFRGFNLYDGASIQPAASLKYSFGDYGTLGGSLWAHFSGEGDRQEEKFTELDETITYENTFGPVALTLGTIWYTYPDSGDDIVDTAEWFGSLAVDTLLSPRLSIFHDYREFDNQYYELAFSHTFEPEALGDGFSVTPFVALGFASNAEKVYDEDSGLMHVTYGASSEVSMGDVTLVPSLNYTSKVDDATVNEFWFGLSFGYSL